MSNVHTTALMEYSGKKFGQIICSGSAMNPFPTSCHVNHVPFAITTENIKCVKANWLKFLYSFCLIQHMVSKEIIKGVFLVVHFGFHGNQLNRYKMISLIEKY